MRFCDHATARSQHTAVIRSRSDPVCQAAFPSPRILARGLGFRYNRSGRQGKETVLSEPHTTCAMFGQKTLGGVQSYLGADLPESYGTSGLRARWHIWSVPFDVQVDSELSGR